MSSCTRGRNGHILSTFSLMFAWSIRRRLTSSSRFATWLIENTRSSSGEQPLGGEMTSVGTLRRWARGAEAKSRTCGVLLRWGSGAPPPTAASSCICNWRGCTASRSCVSVPNSLTSLGLAVA